MDEVSNLGAELETQTESASPQTDPSHESTISESQAETTQVASDQHDKHWIRKVRRDRDDAIRAKEDAERKAQIQEELIKQLMANQGGQTQQAGEEDILAEIQREEYVAGDKVARAIKRQQEEFDKKLAKFEKAQAQQAYSSQEAELRKSYPDIDDVVNRDTLDTLKETNPRLFQRVANLLKVDPIDGAAFAYETIVSAGLVDKAPETRRAKEVEKKLEQNKKTVQSPLASDKRPIAQAMSYPESRAAREALWNETLRYASLGGGGY